MISQKIEIVSERRVYLLPAELLVRVRKFQADFALPSEVEAVRRLIDYELRRRESIQEIFLNCLRAQKAGGTLIDVRTSVLGGHPLVKEIELSEQATLEFTLFHSHHRGKISENGVGSYSHNWRNNDWSPVHLTVEGQP